jgi:hypothetical protein
MEYKLYYDLGRIVYEHTFFSYITSFFQILSDILSKYHIYVILLSLFNDAVGSWGSVAPNDRLIVKSEPEKMWKEVVVA